MPRIFQLFSTALLLMALLHPATCHAELKFSPVFGDAMVVQRDKPIHVWGWTTPGTAVTAEIAGHAGSADADDQGRFDMMLDPLPAGGPHQLVVQADQKRVFNNVLVGEVWVCSGQSNMAWDVRSANDADLEALTAKFPEIRIISVPKVGSQEPLNDFDGKWEACNPENVKTFSAVGYFFGRQLHQTLDVPIGLIDNAWGGSSAEAWVDRKVLQDDGKYADLLSHYDQMAEGYDPEQDKKNTEARIAKWKSAGSKGRRPQPLSATLNGNHRPANLYNGVLNPIIGYTIAGTIWYQGESNASRAHQYRELFPLMIQNWRDAWGQGDFPFYWVQLADFRGEVSQPAQSDWAELREAQTMTLSRLPNTGEAVIIDLGEASDIHPRNKQDVAKRLARWALAKDYGYQIPCQSPTFAEMVVGDSVATLTFDHVGGGLDTFDVTQPIGFTIAGEDKKFVPAKAKISGKNTIEVSSPEVANPVAVRYAWADNPVCNVQSREGLPMTPFRTDQWPGITVGKTK